RDASRAGHGHPQIDLKLDCLAQALRPRLADAGANTSCNSKEKELSFDCPGGGDSGLASAPIRLLAALSRGARHYGRDFREHKDRTGAGTGVAVPRPNAPVRDCAVAAVRE